MLKKEACLFAFLSSLAAAAPSANADTLAGTVTRVYAQNGTGNHGTISITPDSGRRAYLSLEDRAASGGPPAMSPEYARTILAMVRGKTLRAKFYNVVLYSSTPDAVFYAAYSDCQAFVQKDAPAYLSPVDEAIGTLLVIWIDPPTWSTFGHMTARKSDGTYVSISMPKALPVVPDLPWEQPITESFAFRILDAASTDQARTGDWWVGFSGLRGYPGRSDAFYVDTFTMVSSNWRS